MKNAFMCRLSDRWRSIRNAHSSQNCGKEHTIFIFLIVQNDQKCPNKMVDCSGGEF